ncbi:hypothetical protein CBR_g58801 [Chara braunii]|uniref:Glutamate-rich WD repeat-containing protein 1 n=1 Tax=Chara braunii TaxID=69332 RepID=A0A388K8D7_CHABU|nr:hypothetical protein CBR_g58801 [Chara braunii]|eukprot:GBG66310.1 hypothetical protein CBR_g58801 [Chara braunii]
MARVRRVVKKKKTKKKKKAAVSVSNDVAMGEGSAGRSGAQKESGSRPSVWRPGVDEIGDEEELQYDPTAYECLHWFSLEWPSLSFDIMRDNLGAQRMEFPHTLYFVAGTQALMAKSNGLVIVKLSNLTKMKHPKLQNEGDDGNDDGDDDDSGDSSSSSEEDEEEEDKEVEAMRNSKTQPFEKSVNADLANKKKPGLRTRRVAHHGGVNRVRSMMQHPGIVASWAETGHVQVWDLSTHLNALAEVDQSGMSTSGAAAKEGAAFLPPLQVFTGHAEEGFALDWSPVTAGRLVSGDNKKGIHLWEPSVGGKWTIERSPYRGHVGSVEDLQWSPTEADVFASCSADQTMRIWDTRSRDASALTVKAHAADINVISWNRLASCMLASGCDDGSFRIWDLRNFKEDSFVAHFNYHSGPITSIEWSCEDSSMIACTSADNVLTIWDLSLERDPEEEEEFTRGDTSLAAPPEDLPSQLLFVHQGQKDLKEVHWHPQIPGLLISTASDGFNVFKPSNLANV